ncbi:MAG: type II toxin-antitoxin system PemK/MazF family toxin [Parcubacteria group bacterium]|nr:type II toxin-antitoxin system PemK/MazF family toxin [Parcubacteria group bacterium]
MTIKKDFDSWNTQKKTIHNFGENKYYHPRDIWWCNLGANIGFEQDGTGVGHQRPVFILKELSRNTCLVIPLTVSTSQHPMRIFLGTVNNKKASAIISQMRVVDTKRFINKIGIIDKEIFDIIRKTVKNMI